MPKANIRKALFWELASCFLFSTFSLTGGLLSSSLSTAQLLFFKNCGSLVFCLLFFGPIHKVKSFSPYWLRSLSGCAGTFLFFYALKFTPLSTLTAIHYLIPIFTSLGAAFLFKEAVSRTHLLLLVVSLFGMGLILQPELGRYSWNYLIGLSGAVCWAASNLFLKQGVSEDSPCAVVFYLALIMTLFSIPFAWIEWTPIQSMDDFALLVLLGLTSFLTHYTQSCAFALAPLVELQPVEYSRLIFSTIFGIIFLNQPLLITTLIGGTVLFLSNYYVIRNSKIKEQKI